MSDPIAEVISIRRRIDRGRLARRCAVWAALAVAALALWAWFVAYVRGAPLTWPAVAGLATATAVLSYATAAVVYFARLLWRHRRRS